MVHDRPTRRRNGRFSSSIPALFALLLLSGCISETREQQLGDDMAATINSQVPLVRNPLLNAYVSSLGRTIAAVSGRPDLEFRFYIVNSAQVNAFALPGGHIYLTRGLIERTENGSELAGVLAHEIGHVVERHGVQKLERHLRTGSLVNVMYSIILGGIGGEPELLQRNALQFAGVVWNASHSREQEEEADRLAVQYLIDAGIDPTGVLTLLETLLEEEEADASSPAAGWFSTHPLTETRIAQTRLEIRNEMDEEGQLVSLENELEFTSYPAFLRLVSALPPPPDTR